MSEEITPITEKPSLYRVVTADGDSLLESEDIFAALDLLKKQDPGSKMIRVADKKLLAYTTAPKFEVDDPDAKKY